jgi:PAS domain S-box-containing protein
MVEENREGFFRRIFEESPVAILVVAPDFQITDANVSAQRLLGRSLDHLRECRLRQFIAQSDQEAYTAIRADIEARAGYVTRPLLLRLRDETKCEVSLIAAVFRDGRGNPEFILVTLLERGKSISEDML